MKTLHNLSPSPDSIDANTKLVFLRRRTISKLLYLMVGLLIVSPANLLAIVIDGKVDGFMEGYTSGFDVTFDIEGGTSGVPGGKLFLDETGTLIFVGMILPLSIVDNTYGDTKASDWGTKEHFLIGGGGGKSLEGSDSWQFPKVPVDGGDLELKLDYIDEDRGAFNARVEKFRLGRTDLDQNLVTFATSLHYNYNTLGLTQFFGSKADDEDGDPIDSPGPAPLPYNFDPPAQYWIPEIMYEFSIDKSVVPTFAALEFYSSTFHVSPNKLSSKHKVWPEQGTPIEPIPEPGTLLLLSTGLAGLAGYSFRRRKKA